MVAPNSAVTSPITATTNSDVPEASAWNNGLERATRNTPAATIVAAWIRALTGVGPSMASGSQTCSGTWPDLPTAPQNISSDIAVETAMALIVASATSFESAEASQHPLPLS